MPALSLKTDRSHQITTPYGIEFNENANHTSVDSKIAYRKQDKMKETDNRNDKHKHIKHETNVQNSKKQDEKGEVQAKLIRNEVAESERVAKHFPHPSAWPSAKMLSVLQEQILMSKAHRQVGPLFKSLLDTVIAVRLLPMVLFNVGDKTTTVK